MKIRVQDGYACELAIQFQPQKKWVTPLTTHDLYISIPMISIISTTEPNIAQSVHCVIILT